MVPVAVTLNIAVCPAVTVILAGWTVSEGATGLPPPPPEPVEFVKAEQPASKNVARIAANEKAKFVRRTRCTPSSI
jgi:hypothetical protein